MKKSNFERLSDFAKWASLFSGKIFVNIAVYVDESGIHDKTGQLPGSEMVIVGGYGASIEDWSEICVRWQAVLKKYDDVPYFHYSELRDRKQRLNNPEWPYYGWDEKRCDEFLIELAKATYKSNARFFGGFFRAKDAHAYYAQNPAISKNDPHKSCIAWFYDAFRRDMNLFWPDKADTFFFDQTDDTGWRKAVNEVHFFHQKAEPRIKELVGFCDKKDAKHIPLQAADLAVSRFRRKMAKCFEQPPDPPEDLDFLLFNESFLRTLFLSSGGR